jgi:hypothetical protein
VRRNIHCGSDDLHQMAGVMTTDFKAIVLRDAEWNDFELDGALKDIPRRNIAADRRALIALCREARWLAATLR